MFSERIGICLIKSESILKEEVMETREKEVYFDQYCKTCKHEKKAEDEDPCYDCLAEPVNIDSHKPIYHKEK